MIISSSIQNTISVIPARHAPGFTPAACPANAGGIQKFIVSFSLSNSFAREIFS
jgi:hypothetical protein